MKGAIPVSIGGDDGITNPVIRGLDGFTDITIIQIDAHLDWRDERFGEKDGYSSPAPPSSCLRYQQYIRSDQVIWQLKENRS